MEMGQMGDNFSQKLVLPHHLQLSYTDQHQKIQITYLENCLSTFNFIPVIFFPLLLCISTKKQNKAEDILNLNHRLNKVEHKFTNMHTAFDFFMNTFIKGPI